MKSEELVYIPIDNEKNLINIANIDYLSEFDKEILDGIVSDIARIIPYGKGRIYLRGSLAYGKFVKGVSDMDLVVVSEFVTAESQKSLDSLIAQYNLKYADRYQLVDISYYPKEIFFVPENNRLLMNILFTGILLYNNDLPLELPNLRFDKELQVRIAKQTINDCHATLEMIKNKRSIFYMNKKREADFLCVWFMRDLCRGLIALVMNKKEVFSLNVSTCCYEFSLTFPDYADFVLELWEAERFPCKEWEKLIPLAQNAINVYEKILKEENVI